MDTLETIWQTLALHCDPTLLFQSRVHRFSAADTPSAKVWIKREDEGGFGISGSKKRKYASLIPFLLKKNIQQVGLIGGARSNHIVGLLQLLRENRIGVHLFLKASHAPARGGNAFLLDLLSEKSEITWISSEGWPKVEEIASQWQAIEAEQRFVVPEGGFCQMAIPGAASLFVDIRRNEAVIGQSFEHIFVDAGTGFTAGVLQLMNGLATPTRQIHIVRIAGDARFHEQQSLQVHRWLEDLLQTSVPKTPLHTYPPFTASSFGSVNQTVKQAVRRYAQQHGILCDPVYTAKFFLTAEHLIQRLQLQGNCLLIHGGGGTGLMGFAEKWTEGIR